MSHVPGTILKNCKSEYGVVLEDGRICIVSKEQAEFIAGKKLDEAPAPLAAAKEEEL